MGGVQGGLGWRYLMLANSAQSCNFLSIMNLRAELNNYKRTKVSSQHALLPKREVVRKLKKGRNLSSAA